MRTSPLAPTTISFRHLLIDEIRVFLQGEGLLCEPTAEALSELLVTLARYREEGASLFPLVFMGESRESALPALGGVEMIDVGQGPRLVETMQRALKVCAPLGRGGWSIFIERRPGVFGYGVFRTDGFVLNDTPMERLRQLATPSLRLIGVVQQGENILELRGASGAARLLYLSGARSGALPVEAVKTLTGALIRDASPSLQGTLRTFFRHALIEVLRAPHGALIAVVPAGTTSLPMFSDGTMLARPIEIRASIERYLGGGGEGHRSAIEAAYCLLLSMVGSDGVTVLDSGGAIVGFNLFVHHDASPGAGPIGGARRRTFQALSARVGHELVAAFYRSQDGAAECVAAP